jgi:hypothetical protein
MSARRPAYAGGGRCCARRGVGLKRATEISLPKVSHRTTTLSFCSMSTSCGTATINPSKERMSPSRSARDFIVKKPTSKVSTRSVDELVKTMEMSGISKSHALRLCADID